MKGHCPNCGPDRWADVRGHYRGRIEDDENGIWFETDYRILQCRGCEAIYFQTDEIFSEEVRYHVDAETGESEAHFPHTIVYWPAPSKRQRPDWANELFAIDGDLYSLFESIYVALNNDLRVLSAIGIRTAFDRASELLSVDPALNFSEKLEKLVALGKIGVSEKDTLDILTDAGSAAAHRGWKPKPNELGTMMSMFEAFLYRTLILDAEARKLKQNVPTRPKRDKTPDEHEKGDAQEKAG